MEKEIEILFYKDINSNRLRVFVDKKGSSGKKFNLIKMQESLIDSGQYSPEEKKTMKENLMINHYISLLQDGYQYMQILNEINNSLKLTKLRTEVSDPIPQLDVMDTSSQLEDEKQYLEKANILLSQLEQVENFPFVRLPNGAIVEMQPTDENDLNRVEHKTPRR